MEIKVKLVLIVEGEGRSERRKAVEVRCRDKEARRYVTYKGNLKGDRILSKDAEKVSCRVSFECGTNNESR